MVKQPDGDVGVDVLIIGAGVPALHVARSLHPRYRVAVVSEPAVRYESYDTAGRFSAGYTGDDVARIQPARRAAGWWRHWAESHRVPHRFAPSLHVLRPEDEAARTRLWADAGLATRRLAPGGLPPALAGGALEGSSNWVADDDVVMDPEIVAAHLRAELGEHVVEGEVLRLGLVGDRAVDYAAVQLSDGRTVSFTPRYVVLASDAANGGLLQKVAAAHRDRVRRREAADLVRRSQAVRRRPTVVVRGQLPPVAVHVEGMDITALPDGAAPREGEAASPGETVWLVQPPVDDSLTVLGPEDLRFAPALDPKVVAETLDRLFELSPEVRRRSRHLRWGAWVARRSEHPLMAGPGAAEVARPTPARIETLGLDACVALWPSHLAHSMVVGDVVAERVERSLGGPAGVGALPADWPRPAPASVRARWRRPDFAWRDWAGFAGAFGYPV
jgi:hypothetical protein